jgi:putative transposase
MTISFARHQFPPAIIQHAVWLYVRFTLSYRDVEDLLAERGLDVSYETVRRWVLIRAVVRPRTSPSTSTAYGAVASRRDGRDNCGPAVLAVARGRR